ncbi:MAG: DUF2130 domain-containing protein [Bacilli bacterium]|nr:DUF2130 domain-containing protein [Bacilli bacterium]
MAEIKCPKCGEIIKISKDDYNALLNDIEKEEINNRVEERVKNIEKQYDAEYKLKAKETESEQKEQIGKLNNEIAVLKERLQNADVKTKSAVIAAESSLKDELQKKNEEINNLKNEYEFTLKAKDEEIKRWKEFQVGDSTKDLGESLEKYCKDSFDEIRSVAYPNAYFDKDNDVDEEGKGDFIFKDFQEGIELVSIMFEMKNQKDTTKTKHKNEDFLQKLDKNRKTKGCEYAVLVSTLEEESKLYNKGIVDVSHIYPKMYVIRPQFFLTIISLISTMARNSFADKKKLIEYQQENLDITNFENNVKTIADKITNDYEKAEAIYNEVDKMCDDIIKKVENFRKQFRTATNWVEKAKKQLPELEVRKLTRGNKTMKEKFEELNQ